MLALGSLALVLAYFLLPRMIADDPALLSLSRGAWVYFAPPAWFAGAVEMLTGQVGRQGIVLTLIAGVGSAAVVAAAMNTISMDYSKRISELASSSVTAEEEGVGESAKRRPFFRLGLSTLGSGEERAG